MPLPKFPAGKTSVVLSRSSYEELRKEMEAAVQPDPNDFVIERKGRKVMFRNRRREEFQRANTGTLPPFTVQAGSTVSGETVSYYVTVSPGMVCEENVTVGTAADAVILWSCPSRLDDDGNPFEFPITDGEAIFVRCMRSAAGPLADVMNEEEEVETVAVDLVVATKTTKSLNHIPTIQDGVLHIKLAEFSVVDGEPVLTPFAAGSHVWLKSGLSADFFLEDCDGDAMATPPVPPTVLLRQTFQSGTLAAVDADTTERPEHAAAYHKGIQSCHYIDFYPL